MSDKEKIGTEAFPYSDSRSPIARLRHGNEEKNRKTGLPTAKIALHYSVM